jgi:predicted phosphodiesterase
MGTNDWADDFARHQTLYFHVFKTHYKEFKYIGLGDTCELLETHKFEKIRKAHSHIFWLMSNEFYDKDPDKNRFYLVYGNHDAVWKNPKTVAKMLYSHEREREKTEINLFPEIEVNEAIVLHHKESDKKIFLIHGHQVDFFNYRLWGLGWLFLPIWKTFFQKLMGWRDLTSPAQNFTKRGKVKDRLEEWVNKDKNIILIAGHTHRSSFPTKPDEPSYINAGSCVHPRCITGVEIEGGEITLIKWEYTIDDNGNLKVKRELFKDTPPKSIKDFGQVIG